MQPTPERARRIALFKSARVRPARVSRGFSLFELIVYILAASILFSVMLNRYRDFPGEAERASFLAVLGQLRAGVNLQMMTAIAEGSWNRLDRLDGSNPMNLMLEVPANYLGEFATVNASLPRRSWYFDTSAGHLVYQVNRAEQVQIQVDGVKTASDQIRFVMRNVYGDSGWQGLELSPIYPYEWRRVALERELSAE